MSLFSSIFSKKSARLAQIWQAQQTEEQNAQALLNQASMQQQLDAAAADRTEQLRLLQEQGESQLAAAAEVARNAQRAAEEANARALLTPADSEDARTAAEERQRKLQGKRGFLSTIVSRANGSSLGQAPVATAQLLGAA